MPEEAAPSMIPFAVGMSSVSCLMILLWLYNIVVLIGFAREESDEAASGLSKAAWAISLLAVVLGPCWWLGALISIIMSRVERGRIYRDESTTRSATPARMAGLNGGVLLFLYVLTVVTAILGYPR